MTDDHTAALTQDQMARREMKEAAARQRRAKKEEKDLKKLRVEVAKQRNSELFALDSAIADSRADAWAANGQAIKIAINRPFVPYDEPPTAKIENVTEWSHGYRRRAWATAFARKTFDEKSGTSALFLLLSLAALMENQGKQTIEADIPHIVRISAMDYKTVRSGLQNLRDTGHLLRLGPSTYALSDANLIPLSESPLVLETHLGGRFFLGNYEHDAFGGRYGIKTTEIRIWAWLLLNPDSTRATAVEGARVGKATAYRVIGDLVEMRLARADENDKYVALCAKQDAELWLNAHVVSRGLFGAVKTRVFRATEPAFIKQKRKPSTQDKSQEKQEDAMPPPPIRDPENDLLKTFEVDIDLWKSFFSQSEAREELPITCWP